MNSEISEIFQMKTTTKKREESQPLNANCFGKVRERTSAQFSISSDEDPQGLDRAIKKIDTNMKIHRMESILRRSSPAPKKDLEEVKSPSPFELLP